MSVGAPSSVPSDPGGGGEWLVDEQATEATVPRSQARPLTFAKALFATSTVCLCRVYVPCTGLARWYRYGVGTQLCFSWGFYKLAKIRDTLIQ